MAFPISPTIDDQHTEGDNTYIWNGAAWDILTSGTFTDAYSKSEIDTMQGTITLGTDAITSTTLDTDLDIAGNGTGVANIDGNAITATDLADKKKQLHVTDALSVSGTTVTLTKGDGTTESITTQDTNTDTNTWRGIDNVPVNGQTTESISSNWRMTTLLVPQHILGTLET